MITTITPLQTIFDKFCEQTITRSLLRVYLGVGLYFLILLLACHDVARLPGPSKEGGFSEVAQLWLKSNLDFRELTVKELCPAIFEINKTISKESARFEAILAENAELAARVSRLEKRLENFEKQKRRKNVVVFGVPTNKNLREAIDDVIFKKLTLKKQPQDELIKRAYRFGQDSPKRPILVRFKNESDKERAMHLASHLKGTQITISDDLTPEERQNRRKIVEAHKVARNAKIESKVQRKGLCVNGEILSPSELNNSDWLENFLQKKVSVSVAMANESSPSFKPFSPMNDIPSVPIKKPNSRKVNSYSERTKSADSSDSN